MRSEVGGDGREGEQPPFSAAIKGSSGALTSEKELTMLSHIGVSGVWGHFVELVISFVVSNWDILLFSSFKYMLHAGYTELLLIYPLVGVSLVSWRAGELFC